MLLKSNSIIFLINFTIIVTESGAAIPRSELENQIEIQPRALPTNCAEATLYTKKSGIYELSIPDYYSYQTVKVYCDAETFGGGWAVILRREDGSVDFYRSWNIYTQGFGDLDSEFFLGLNIIHGLTKEKSQELLFILEDFEGEQRYETYDKFAIGDQYESYALHTLGKASGTAGDSFSIHHTRKFSTLDANNGPQRDTNCATEYTGAWWYSNPCHRSNLAGKYNDTTFGKGVNWLTFRGHEYSLKRAVMMIRPRK